MYKFADKCMMPRGLSADVVGQTLESLIAVHGAVRPEDLVETARNPSSPLHVCFEWDDSAAATEYRLEQARRVIRSVVLIREDRPDTVIRAFVNPERNGEWKSVDVAMSNPTDRELLLEQARSDWRSFERRYRVLSELSPAMTAMSKALEPPPAKKAPRKKGAASAMQRVAANKRA